MRDSEKLQSQKNYECRVYPHRGGHVFGQQDIRVADILTCNKKIIAVGKDLACELLSLHSPAVHTISTHGKIVTLGIIDKHIHIIGGEGSFKTRSPELHLSALLRGGITSVVGLLGTDSMTRSVENLIAKAKALQKEGMNAYCLCGSYDYPSPTITGSVKKTLCSSKILGVKLALSNHRAPLISKEDLKHLASDVRVGSMLAGKNAYIKLHTGSGKQCPSFTRDVEFKQRWQLVYLRPARFITRDRVLSIQCRT